MTRRHSRDTDWGTLALRLEDIVAAHSGGDIFEEVHALLIAKLVYEHRLLSFEAFLPHSNRVERIQHLLDTAATQWPGLHTTSQHAIRAALDACSDILSQHSVTEHHDSGLDAVFEHLTTRAAKGSKGQYFTPRHVAAHMLEVLAPTPGERVLDPACGSGALLVLAQRAEKRCELFGADISERAVRIATSLVPRGVTAGAIRCLDSSTAHATHRMSGGKGLMSSRRTHHLRGTLATYTPTSMSFIAQAAGLNVTCSS